MCSPAMLVFVRHAAVDDTENGLPLLCGRHNVRLSAEGRSEVRALRRRLAVEPACQALYSSPLRRALDTALAAPAPLLSSLRILNSLAEIDCGVLDGHPIDEVRRRHPDVWHRNQAQDDDRFAWPGGESYRGFRRRVLRAVRAIARRHRGRRVLIVTHAGVVNQVLGTIAGQNAARWHNLRPRNASLTTVLWDDIAPSVCSFDDCSHLEPTRLIRIA